jgi:hypothetical protein
VRGGGGGVLVESVPFLVMMTMMMRRRIQNVSCCCCIDGDCHCHFGRRKIWKHKAMCAVRVGAAVGVGVRLLMMVRDTTTTPRENDVPPTERKISCCFRSTGLTCSDLTSIKGYFVTPLYVVRKDREQ